MPAGEREHEHDPHRKLDGPDPQDGARAEERTGPLLIERHVKEDGRALILFRMEER